MTTWIIRNPDGTYHGGKYLGSVTDPAQAEVFPHDEPERRHLLDGQTWVTWSREKHTMTIQDLLDKLSECADMTDTEEAHMNADGALLAFIGNDQVRAAFDAVGKWYA